jgi:hypothetical protein
MYSFEILEDMIPVHWKIWPSKKNLGCIDIDTLQFDGIGLFFFMFLSIKFNTLRHLVKFATRRKWPAFNFALNSTNMLVFVTNMLQVFPDSINFAHFITMFGNASCGCSTRRQKLSWFVAIVWIFLLLNERQG